MCRTSTRPKSFFSDSALVFARTTKSLNLATLASALEGHSNCCEKKSKSVAPEGVWTQIRICNIFLYNT